MLGEGFWRQGLLLRYASPLYQHWASLCWFSCTSGCFFAEPLCGGWGVCGVPADALSAAGCVVTYVPRIRGAVGGSYVDHAAVDVPVGAALVNGSMEATVTVDVPCPVANGVITLLVSARDGANNTREAGETVAWVRDTLAPVTVASLAHPELFFFLAAANASVSNATSVAVALGSSSEVPRSFNVLVSRRNPLSAQAGVFNVTGGLVNVSIPWDGPVTISVVRIAAPLSEGGACARVYCTSWTPSSAGT